MTIADNACSLLKTFGGQLAMAARKAAAKAETARKRSSFATQIDPDLLERARNAAFWLRLPLASLAEAALAAEIGRLEKKHNGGKPFQQRGGDLLRGARPK
jgi:hypothetical protein